jgi:hypothetical protein
MTDEFRNRLEAMSREVRRRLGLSEIDFQKFIPLVEEQLIRQECRRVFQLERDGELLAETEQTLAQGYLSDDDDEDATWRPLNF